MSGKLSLLNEAKRYSQGASVTDDLMNALVGARSMP
jgi:hypothetical protein